MDGDTFGQVGLLVSPYQFVYCSGCCKCITYYYLGVVCPVSLTMHVVLCYLVSRYCNIDWLVGGFDSQTLVLVDAASLTQMVTIYMPRCSNQNPGYCEHTTVDATDAQAAKLSGANNWSGEWSGEG